jgi:hypothetical protein
MGWVRKRKNYVEFEFLSQTFRKFDFDIWNMRGGRYA